MSAVINVAVVVAIIVLLAVGTMFVVNYYSDSLLVPLTAASPSRDTA
jgi:hypothetical protein